MYQDSDHLVSSLQARIGNRVANCEMVDDLSQLRGQAEISVHLVVKKRSDACRSQAKRLGRKIHSLTNSTRLEMPSLSCASRSSSHERRPAICFYPLCWASFVSVDLTGCIATPVSSAPTPNRRTFSGPFPLRDARGRPARSGTSRIEWLAIQDASLAPCGTCSDILVLPRVCISAKDVRPSRRPRPLPSAGNRY